MKVVATVQVRMNSSRLPGKALKKILDLFNKNRSPMGEINNQVMHYKKVKKYFNWEPNTDFSDGLKITINWYKNYYANNE